VPQNLKTRIALFKRNKQKGQGSSGDIVQLRLFEKPNSAMENMCGILLLLKSLQYTHESLVLLAL
jgi:hypothetical protein